MTTQKLYYKINEVADLLGLPSSTLRWWEREIEPFKPMRSAGGQRRYAPADLEMARKIKYLLYERGMSIEAASRHLKDSALPKRLPQCRSSDDAIKTLAALSKFVKDNPKALAMIEAISKYLEKAEMLTNCCTTPT